MTKYGLKHGSTIFVVIMTLLLFACVAAIFFISPNGISQSFDESSFFYKGVSILTILGNVFLLLLPPVLLILTGWIFSLLYKPLSTGYILDCDSLVIKQNGTSCRIPYNTINSVREIRLSVSNSSGSKLKGLHYISDFGWARFDFMVYARTRCRILALGTTLDNFVIKPPLRKKRFIEELTRYISASPVKSPLFLQPEQKRSGLATAVGIFGVLLGVACGLALIFEMLSAGTDFFKPDSHSVMTYYVHPRAIYLIAPCVAVLSLITSAAFELFRNVKNGYLKMAAYILIWGVCVTAGYYKDFFTRSFTLVNTAICVFVLLLTAIAVFFDKGRSLSINKIARF